MAWTAVRGSFDWPVIFIFLSALFWAMAYDTIYALMDCDDDIRVGVQSTAIFFGRHAWLGTGILFALSTIFLIMLGISVGLGKIYFVTLMGVVAYFTHQIFLLKKNPGEPALFSLFKSHAVVGLILLAGIFWGFHLT